jgi:Anti-sigma-K factor rskA, C-terminal/Putative zinc-finger
VNLTHDEIEGLLGAYALDAVEPDEVEQVERHLETCPRCRSEVAGHREVAAMLGNTGGDAPEGLWDRIAGQLEEEPPPMRLAVTGPAIEVVPLSDRRRARRARIGIAVVGAAAALAIGVLGVEVVRQQDKLDSLEEVVAEDSLARAANLALTDPDAVTADLQSVDGSVTGSVVVLPDGTGYLLAHELSSLDGTDTYQLWGKTDSGLISLGLLGGEPGEVVPFQAGGHLDAVAITAETEGGVVEPQSAPVVSGTFD